MTGNHEDIRTDFFDPGRHFVHHIGFLTVNPVYRDTNFFIEQIILCLISNDNVNEEPTGNGKLMLRRNEFPDMKIEGDPSNALIPQPGSADELMNKLNEVKNRLNDLFVQYQATTFAGKSKHPGLGFFSAGQWFQFADMHFRHHLRQKKRIDDFLQTNPL